jgi:hypothetical protein
LILAFGGPFFRPVSLHMTGPTYSEEIPMRFSRYAILLVVCGAANAHHGPGQFDSSQPVEVTGAVTDIRYVNPHGYVYFDVTEENGDVVPWRSVLRRAGPASVEWAWVWAWVWVAQQPDSS